MPKAIFHDTLLEVQGNRIVEENLSELISERVAVEGERVVLFRSKIVDLGEHFDFRIHLLASKI